MKTVSTLPPPAMIYKPRVKKHLSKVIIYLTSGKIAIFVCIAATVAVWVGALGGDSALTAGGAAAFVAGCMPWSLRKTARDMRRNHLNTNL